jgi:GT2 family glycosyltransferase
MSISVIIPTYNGAHKILKALDGLAGQTRLPEEVIVVIDGSSDHTATMLKEWKAPFKEFKVLSFENGGRSVARNRGAAAATGELLVFLDDDMRADKQLIAIHEAHHRRHPGSLLTGAQIDKSDGSQSDFTAFKVYLSHKWSSELQDYSGVELPPNLTFLTAANFSVSRSSFFTLGTFDERLTDAEDYDLAIRARKAGIPLFYDHSAFAHHEDPVSCAGYILRMRQYTDAHKRWNTLNPAGPSRYTVEPPSGLKRAFFMLFCKRFWIKSIDSGTWRWMLPHALRYRFYAWVITANGSFFPERVAL